LFALACTRGAGDFGTIAAQAKTIRKGDSLATVSRLLGQPDSQEGKAGETKVAIFYYGPDGDSISLAFEDDRFVFGAIQTQNKLTRLPIEMKP